MKVISTQHGTDDNGEYFHVTAEHDDVQVDTTERRGRWSASAQKKDGGGYQSVLNEDAEGLVSFILNIFRR